MVFVIIVWAGELSFLPNHHCEDHNLLEEEHCHLLHLVVWPRARIISTLKRAAEKQVTLGHNLALDKYCQMSLTAGN